jgi:hypothetical protein
MKWNEFSVDILRDINVCFVASIYMDYLIFFDDLSTTAHGW